MHFIRLQAQMPDGVAAGMFADGDNGVGAHEDLAGESMLDGDVIWC